MDTRFSIEQLDLQEIKEIKGGATDSYQGCIIANGKCSGGGCGIANGNCNLAPVDPRDPEDPNTNDCQIQ
ncbi:MAG: hypothetical protein K2M13_10175 [Muribaculaceae bacterium]|nr:hypothetical protein [Muribaculaceae bacterium]